MWEQVVDRSPKGAKPGLKLDLLLRELWWDRICPPELQARLEECAQELGVRAQIKWPPDAHVVYTFPQAPAQRSHQDYAGLNYKKHCYYTVIVPLTKDPKQAGGTYFRNLGQVVNAYGNLTAFSGDVWHHGTANEHQSHIRCFLFFVFSSAKSDPNLLPDDADGK